MVEIIWLLKILYSPIICSKITCKDADEDEDDVSVSSDSLGEQLFELVDVYNTGHSQKITGMQPFLRIKQKKQLIRNYRPCVLSLKWFLF